MLTTIRRNSPKKFINENAKKNVNTYLGPGSYNLIRDFDITSNNFKGNPFVSKVNK